MRMMVQQWYPVPDLLVIDAHRILPNKLVLCRRDCARRLLKSAATGELDSLVDHRVDRLDACALD